MYKVSLLKVHCVRCNVQLYKLKKFHFLEFRPHKRFGFSNAYQALDKDSPDLNPIENCWIWMKKQLKEENNTSIPELQESIKRLWEEKMSDLTYLQSLVSSMPKRMADVIDRDGGMTKY